MSRAAPGDAARKGQGAVQMGSSAGGFTPPAFAPSAQAARRQWGQRQTPTNRLFSRALIGATFSAERP